MGYIYCRVAVYFRSAAPGSDVSLNILMGMPPNPSLGTWRSESCPFQLRLVGTYLPIDQMCIFSFTNVVVVVFSGDFLRENVNLGH